MRWDERFGKRQKLTTLNSKNLQEINVSDFNSVIISAKITGTNSLRNSFVIQPGTMVSRWETDFLPLLLLTRRGAALVKASAGRHFPRSYQIIPRTYYQLSGPISREIAMLSLRYPISRDTFQRGQHSPKMVRYLPLVLNFTQTHLCDTPFCNVSCDNCAIPIKNKHESFSFSAKKQPLLPQLPA